MVTELCRIMARHGSDKVLGGRPGKKCHDYTLIYHGMFSPVRDVISCVLEVGILRGASLRAWAEYFPNAEIYGLDIREDRLIDEVRIRSYMCDQTSVYSIRLATGGMEFDIVIDDGLHTPKGNITFFDEVFDRVKRYYIVEDVKSKYLEETLAGMKAAHPKAILQVVDLTKKGSKKDNRLIVATH